MGINEITSEKVKEKRKKKAKYLGTERGESRGERKRDLVTNTARAVLVNNQVLKSTSGPVQRCA